MQEIQQEQQAEEEKAMAMRREELQVQGMKTPMADPTKNPALAQQLSEGGPAPTDGYGGATDLPTNN